MSSPGQSNVGTTGRVSSTGRDDLSARTTAAESPFPTGNPSFLSRHVNRVHVLLEGLCRGVDRSAVQEIVSSWVGRVFPAGTTHVSVPDGECTGEHVLRTVCQLNPDDVRRTPSDRVLDMQGLSTVCCHSPCLGRSSEHPGVDAVQGGGPSSPHPSTGSAQSSRRSDGCDSDAVMEEMRVVMESGHADSARGLGMPGEGGGRTSDDEREIGSEGFDQYHPLTGVSAGDADIASHGAEEHENRTASGQPPGRDGQVVFPKRITCQDTGPPGPVRRHRRHRSAHLVADDRLRGSWQVRRRARSI